LDETVLRCFISGSSFLVGDLLRSLFLFFESKEECRPEEEFPFAFCVSDFFLVSFDELFLFEVVEEPDSPLVVCLGKKKKRN
jgi:hypothetical protein